MKLLTLFSIVLSVFLNISEPVFAGNCQGCCSSHGGVVCSNGITKCGDGTSLSSTCRNKGCSMCSSTPVVSVYQSTYSLIRWTQRGTDTDYCIDICDKDWNIYPDLQAIQCGKLRTWSPKNFLNNLGIPDGTAKGFKFYWRVWSPNGYGGSGFEGSVVCE